MIETSRPDDFNLVLRAMPKLKRTDLSNNVHQMRPDMPIIFFTGFSEKPRAGGMESGVEAVMKPYGMKQIAESIEKVLRAQKARFEKT